MARDLMVWLRIHSRKTCLLVVEDNETDAELLALRVRDLGWECDVVESTEAALPLLLSKRHSVVLMDMRLPHAPGQVLVQQIRRTIPWVHVVVTPGDMSDLRFLPPGFHFSVIGKPVTKEALRDIFRKPRK